MSVRRLAEIQPEHFAFSNENEVWADKQIAKYPEGRQASAVLSLLWRAQKQNDYWLPKPAIEAVAQKLGMPYIRVLEVATFYTMFNLAPVGRFFIQMCGTTPCVLAGSDAIKTVLETRVGPQRTVTADGNFSWLEVECLGACCNAPMVQINDDYYEDLSPENFNRLLDDLAAGHPVHIGSQVGRQTSEPKGGLTSLTAFYGADGKGIGQGPSQPANDQAVVDLDAAYDQRTMQQPGAAAPAMQRRDLQDKQSLGRPGQSEDTGTRRTEPVVSGPAHDAETEKQAETKGGPADTPSVPPGHEPKGGK